jgi:hypothetical protein
MHLLQPLPAVAEYLPSFKSFWRRFLPLLPVVFYIGLWWSGLSSPLSTIASSVLFAVGFYNAFSFSFIVTGAEVLSPAVIACCQGFCKQDLFI